MVKLRKTLTFCLLIILVGISVTAIIVFNSDTTNDIGSKDNETNIIGLTMEEQVSNLSNIYATSIDKFALWSLLPEDFDWEAVHQEYLTKITTAESMVEHYEILRSFISHLGDAHSGVRFPPTTDWYFSPIHVRVIEDKIIVRSADSNFIDIPVGSEIVKINQMPAMKYLRENHGYLSNHRPPLTRDTMLAEIFFGAAVTERAFDIELISPEGEIIQRSILFTLEPPDMNFLSMSPQLNYGNVSEEWEYSTDTFRVQRHTSNILRIRVEHFQNEDFAQDIRNYLTNHFEADAVIIDARRHNGGNGGLGYELLSHFIDITELNHLSIIRFDGFRNLDPFNAQSPYVIELNSQSAGLYEIPVVILTDHRSGSAGEDFIAVAKGTNRFTIMGTNTMGITGQLLFFPLRGGGEFFLSTNRTFTADGQDISGNGIAPDITVEQTYDDFLNGIDTQLRAAVEYLQIKIRDQDE